MTTERYKFSDPKGCYFVTLTTVQWVDIFFRKAYKDILVEQFKWHKENDGLRIHAYVIMTSHIHAVVSLEESSSKSIGAVIGKFKEYTCKQLVGRLLSKNESRRNYMVEVISTNVSKRNQDFQIWQHKNHPVLLKSKSWIHQRVEYTHQNPVKEGWVNKSEHYVYSSARDYKGIKGLVPIDRLF
jgi:REP element-mobilizing transposase RayT